MFGLHAPMRQLMERKIVAPVRPYHLITSFLSNLVLTSIKCSSILSLFRPLFLRA